jgi:GNAT superfamily N-acetyltransferase
MVTIRPRAPSDAPALADIVEQTRAADGYPPWLPDGDLAAFVFRHEVLGAWVAEVGTRVVGHVALHPSTADAAMEVAGRHLDLPADELTVVARLMVTSAWRRRGVATRLLRRAVDEAVVMGRWPVLDVAAHLSDAIGFYEASGWVLAGPATIRLPDGSTLRSLVYAAPRSTGPQHDPST